MYSPIDMLHSTLQMLTNIENRLEELFEEIESLPPEKVEAAEKVYYCSIFNIYLHKQARKRLGQH